MKPIFIEALHVFVIVMMSAFVIFSILGATGEYDHWTTRFVRRFRFRRKRNNYNDDQL